MASPARSREIFELARSLRVAYSEAERLSTQFSSVGLPADKVRQAISALNELRAVNAPLTVQFQQLNALLGITQQQFQALTSAQINLASQSKGSFKDLLGGLSQVAFGYQNIVGTVQSLAGKGQQAYNLLIGQNVRLQGELLATQASIVATNKVIADGAEIKDPTKAIKALKEPTDQAIAQLRKGSLDLVGVTSNQLVPIFQLIAQQSSNIGATLGDSSELTLSFAAALGTLQIPLFQAREEVTSILNGTITMNSRLAKSIGLNNEMVTKWKAQGVLVERVTERLSAFRAGNALAAQTIDGISSNIQEVIDEITRVAGEPLIEPIVKQLDLLYQFLKQNQDEIRDITSSVVGFFLDLGQQLGGVIKLLEPTLKTLGEALFNGLSAQATAAGDVLKTLVAILVDFITIAKPLLDIVANITSAIASFASTPVGQVLLQLVIALKLVSSSYIFLTGVVAAATLALDKFIVSVALSGGGLTGAIPILGKASAAFATFGVAATAAGGGALGFAKALFTVKVAASSAIPVLAAATAVALTFRKAAFVENINDQQEEYRKQIDASTESALKLATGLKRLNDVETATGKLTKEEEEQRKRLRIAAEGQIEGQKRLLQSLKEVQPENAYQTATQQTQIANVERYIKLLQKQSGEVKTQAVDIPVLGSIYTQLGNQVDQALTKFRTTGLTDELMKSAKNLLDAYGKQNALGAVDPAKLAEGIKEIRDDARVQIEIRLQAQQTLTKLLQGETDKRVKAVEAETLRIKTLRSDGFIGEVESQRLLTQEKRRQLQIQIDAVKKAIADEQKLREEQTRQTIAKFDTEITEAQKRKVAAEKAIIEGKNVAQNRANVRLADTEIKELEAKKRASSQSLKIDSETQAQNKSQLAKFNESRATIDRDARKLEKEERIKDFAEKQAIADAYYENGLIGQAEYNDLSYGYTYDRLQEELRQLEGRQTKLNEYQKRTGKFDKEAQEELNTQRSEISKKLIQNEVKLQDERIRLLEQKQKEAYDLVILSEAERATAIAQFRLEQPILVAEANRRETEANRQKIEDEVALEQEKLDQLLAQESLGNEARERDRIAKINSSKVKLAQLTTQLVNSEIQERQRLFEVVKEQLDYEIAERQNVTTATVQGLEREKQARDILNQSIAFERDLIESKKGLLDSVSGFYQSELNILSQTTTKEREKKQIAETIAEIRLKTVREQIKLEQEVLNINLQQKQAALDIEALNLKSQAAQSQADVLDAQSKRKITEADPNATDAQKEAARLGVDAAVIRQQGIQAQIDLLPQKQALLGLQSGLEREALDRRSQTSIDQAELERANAESSRGERRRRLRDVRASVSRRIGTDGTSRSSVARLGEQTNFGRFLQQRFDPQSLQPDPRAIAQTQAAFAQSFPGVNFAKLPTSQLSVGQAIVPPTPGNVVTGDAGRVVRADAVNITLNTYLTQGDIESGKFADKMVQPVRQELREIGLKLLER